MARLDAKRARLNLRFVDQYPCSECSAIADFEIANFDYCCERQPLSFILLLLLFLIEFGDHIVGYFDPFYFFVIPSTNY